tara:strand:- start:1979 stop:2317 length:339 start_codon:yes stop_codon:yes gene_type:complete
MSISKYFYLIFAIIIIIQIFRGFSADINDFEKVSDNSFSLEIRMPSATMNSEVSEATKLKNLEEIKEVLKNKNMCPDGFKITKSWWFEARQRGTRKLIMDNPIYIKYLGDCL